MNAMSSGNSISVIYILVFVGALIDNLALASKCPDETTCSQGVTCCQFSDELNSQQGEKWWHMNNSIISSGCCPFIDGMCCASSEPHEWSCCPSGSSCDVERSVCTHGALIQVTGSGSEECSSSCPDASTFNRTSCKCESTPARVHVTRRRRPLQDNLCPGGEYRCPEGDTCCRLDDETFGCCEGRDAVCCDDHVNCCPNGYKCEKDSCRKFNASK